MATETVEINNIECAVCTYCGKTYPTRDVEKDRALEIPTTCDRCFAPMDDIKAKQYADTQAEKTKDEAITTMGKMMRGESVKAVAK